MRRAAPALLLLLACHAEPIPSSRVFPAGTSFPVRDRVVDGTRLRVIDTGTGSAILLIHGLGASMYSWRHQLPPLIEAGYRVIAFDNRGFGFSDRPEQAYGNEDYARLVVALLDSLGVNEAVLVGHSMGAAIAGEVALANPEKVKGMVLIAPAGYGPFTLRAARWPIVGAVATRFLSRGAVAATLRSLFADPRRVSEDDIDQYYAPVAAPGYGAALRRVLREFQFDALRGRLGAVRVPTLVLWGQADRVIPFQAAAGMTQELPRAAFSAFQDAGHNVQEEQPAAVNRVLIDFLRNGLPGVPPDLAANGSSARARSTTSRTRADSGSGESD